MATKTGAKNQQGKTAWEWIKTHSGRHGVLIVPDGLTVGMLEEACGKGALSAARRYCEGLSGLGTGSLDGGSRGEVYPYAGGVMNWRASADETDHEGSSANEWTPEQKDEYYRTYWLPKYGPDCHFVRKIDCERPEDHIYIRYGQIG